MYSCYDAVIVTHIMCCMISTSWCIVSSGSRHDH